MPFTQSRVSLYHLAATAKSFCEQLTFHFQGHVVCHQMGFTLGAAQVFSNSHFGMVPADFSYDNVQCIGTETNLDDCPHDNSHNCSNFEGAGVECDPTVIGRYLLNWVHIF